MDQTRAREPRQSTDENLKSLTKIVRILDCFSGRDRNLSLAGICEKTGFPRSTTHRLLASMRDVGFLDQDRGRDRYRLGLKLFELGNIVLANMDLHREARPYADALSRISGLRVHLAVFDGYRAVVINRSDPGPEATTAATLIEAAPVHCTSVGKAILAFQTEAIVDRVVQLGLTRFTDTTITDPFALRAELENIRACGYAVDNAEHQPGLRCIGAPIHDASGKVIAGISVSGPSWKIPDLELEGLAKIVVHHASSISSRI